MDHIYDVIIFGAGPAGLSAGLYAGRSRLDTLIIEKGQAGGQIINTDEIENYPGQIVGTIDPDAFVVVSDAREVLGEGFQTDFS